MAEIGSGCSLSARHALERAVTEYAQSLGLLKGAILDDDRRAHNLFDALPGLRSLEKLKINYQVVTNGKFIELSNLDELILTWASDTEALSAQELLSKSVSHLAEDGYNILYRVDKFGSFGNMAQVFIPEFDRFHLIRSGLRVAPNHMLL